MGLGRRPTKRDLQDRWDSGAARIRQEVTLRRDARGITPYESKQGYIRRACYDLILSFLGTPELEKVIKFEVQLVRNDTPKSPTFKDNPFYWGLIAINIFETPELRGRIDQIALELLYAHRHRIDANLVVGFLKQAGSPDLIRTKVRKGTVESWYSEKSPD